ncbi:MAG: phosphotransferase family protein [Actinomycetota bacterium]
MELGDMLAQRLGVAITGLTQLSGGASRETWRFAAGDDDLIVQRQRAGDVRDMLIEAEAVRAARAVGVPVPELLDSGRGDDGVAFMILRAVDGETIPRKILRDDGYEAARSALVAQLGRAAAAVHSIRTDAVPGLVAPDQIAEYTAVIDELGEPHPVLELVRRWLLEHPRPPVEPAVVHGDFRLGNVIVGADGLRAVIDWELAHLGDPMEDLGWLAVRAWRFGGDGEVAGLGSVGQLAAAYEEAGGAAVDPAAVHWWQVLGTWKWAVMCIVQANVHLSGVARSHELAAIGRRVCENEFDLLQLLDRSP